MSMINLKVLPLRHLLKLQQDIDDEIEARTGERPPAPNRKHIDGEPIQAYRGSRK